ncbi:NAD-dependent epimerase/dehydratase family protein [Novosphingobium bradum]|uniref:NAD-dependent epimerase/dehydratase family protein n=1 Tax=Novosphingobium bradum TaxID=1737444 RepID=A0ABV7IXS2_9SPHN
MIRDARILVTGATGEVAQPLIRHLAADNEVWGAARFADPAGADKVRALGARPVQVDVGSGDLSALPDNFTYVLHLAFHRGGATDYDGAVRINGEGTGHVLHHCRKARAALVMSSGAVYSAVDDPHAYPAEDSPIGNALTPWSPTSGMAKVAQEAVARFCARAFNLPVVIPRLNTVYGQSPRFLPTMHMDSIMAGREIAARWDPNPHHPIHTDDLCGQLEAMLDAASTPATVVNWGGDEVVTLQEWCAMVGEWSGKAVRINTVPVPGTTRTGGSDQTRRRAITGPATVRFAQGYRRLFDQRHGAAIGLAD